MVVFLYPTITNIYYQYYVNHESNRLESSMTNESENNNPKSETSTDTSMAAEIESETKTTNNTNETIRIEEYTKIEKDMDMSILYDKDPAYIKAYNNTIVNGTGVVVDPFGNDIGESADVIFADTDKGNVFGYIEIPEIKLKLPLYLGATKNHLAWGAAVVQGTSIPIGGDNINSVISGHNGARKKLFSDVPKLSAGSNIIITSNMGKLLYKVVGNKLITPEEMDYLSVVPEKDIITLLTCYPATKEDDRFLVFAERSYDDIPDQIEGELVKKVVKTEVIENKTEATNDETISNSTETESHLIQEYNYLYEVVVPSQEENWYDRLQKYMLIAGIVVVLSFIFTIFRKKKDKNAKE